MDRNEFLVLRSYYKGEANSLRTVASNTGLSLGTVSKVNRALLSLGYIDQNSITPKGLEALKPYKVKNALIMAAGMSRRLAPLSFDKPKGLFEIKDEILIERQIKQLKEAGINEIILVLGYKKESFFYLGDKFDVKILINSTYETKNNCETLYLARNYISRTYICSCDQYFVNNPFNEYEYESCYTATYDKDNKKEIRVKLGSANKIVGTTTKKNGYMIIGYSFWNEEFSSSFLNLIEKHREIGDFDHDFWEIAFFNNLNKLPPMYASIKEEGTIFEFDNLQQLRDFDDRYIENTRLTIMQNISSVLNCKESEISEFIPIKEGLTNTSYIFEVKGKKYVYRHPGFGTSNFINRTHEKEALDIAKKINLDPSFIKMDAKDGWKISNYIEDTRMPDYSNFSDSKIVINKMKELHDANIKINWDFEVWNGAVKYEQYVKKSQGIDMPDFNELKSNIKKIYNKIDNDGLYEKRLCHCDTYQPNWLIKKNNDVVLIDWEYSGSADPGVDVGYYIVDAMYDFDEAKRFIKEYLGSDYSEAKEEHFMSYVALIAYYWFLWALYKQAIGAVMGEVLYNWYYMAKKYSNYVLKRYKYE